MRSPLETYFTALQGKRIIVLGLGVSNRPLVRLMLKYGCAVIGCDRTPREKLDPEVLVFRSEEEDGEPILCVIEDEEELEAVNNLGYKTFFWSFGYDDWDNTRQPDLTKSKNKILSNTHNGEILLLHPTSATNAAILADLIKEWRNMGYSFCTLDQFVNRNFEI